MYKNKTFFYKKNIVIVLLLAMFFVLDRGLKFLAMNLDEDFYLVNRILKFTFHANEFISFSLPFRGTFLNLLILILIIMVLLNTIYLFKKNNKTEVYFWLIIFFGALSNFIDRLRFSFVVDYLEIFSLSVFNLADVMIVAGCFFIILLNFRKIK